MAKTCCCELDPELKTTLKIFLFKHVRNVEFIRKNVMNNHWKCAVIKPSLIMDPFQVVVAANRAVLAEHTRSLITRNVYTEILYNLSLTKNITQSLNKFGVEKENNLLVCILVTSELNDTDIIIPQIDGELIPIEELSNFTNMKDLKSVYKLNSLKCDYDMLDIIVTRMVTKNIISY